MINGEA